ncbi:MAG: LysM peptidoglycan-binding domain-containing protein [Prevotella sp.]|jgi:LysM repeat protein|nr:LysM peptidoglycan-binding domain-containing protein [Prevotella sp.]
MESTKNIYLLLLILTIGFAGISNAHSADVSAVAMVKGDITTHTVVKGETVYSIATTYRTTVEQLYKLNPKAERGIKAGDKLFIPKVKAIAGYSSHIIEAKETLYSVSHMYKVSAEDLKSVNPGLNESTFSIGKTIKIPVYSGAGSSRIEYKVRKGETLYSIGKANNISEEALMKANPALKGRGLKDGMTLIIPRGQLSNIETSHATKGDVVRVGILLPFTDNSGSIQKEKLTEYYEGFLLAVKELKERKLNAEIYTFDTNSEKDTKRLENLLETNEMNGLHLIIGGVSKQQIDILSKFSKRTGAKYVVPFGTPSEIVSDPLLFQMTTSHSNLYSETISAFIKRFNKYNIVFVSETGSDNNKKDFTEELKKRLTQVGVQFKTMPSSNDLTETLKDLLDISGKNILVPTSSSEATLRRITASANLLGETSITLFGYPEWQTYTSQIDNLHKFNAYIYSIFFLDEKQSEVQNFATQFKSWYNKSMINSFPKWGYLGYDTGLYFLTALKQYGSNFENNISSIKVPTLQSSIYFKQVNANGGYINNGLYFIQYKDDGGIDKFDVNN